MKARLSTRDAREKEIAAVLGAHIAKTYLVGEKLPEARQVFHVKVVTAFLRSAIPFSKLDNFKEILEEGSYCLIDRHNLSDLIPFIQKRKTSVPYLKSVGVTYMSFSMGQVCHLGEALCIAV